MLLPKLDPESPLPLYRQIAKQLAAHIAAGTLAAGEELPSTRRLARQLAINRSTVCRAYGELLASGHLASRVGGKTTVRAPLARAERHEAPPPARAGEARQVGAGDIDFRPLSPDPRLAPLDALRRAFNAALSDEGEALLDYGDPRGYAPLRAWIATRMAGLGAPRSSNEILLCNGVQHALDLLLRSRVKPGDTVFVEDPGYSALLPLLARHGARAVGIPVREDGLDLAALSRALAATRPSLIYTMPNFQNPTGITTGIAQREALVALARAHAVPLVEDGFSEELKYFGRAVPPLAALDSGETVIHLGTFSKLLSPGLRVGWIAAPAAQIDALAALRRDTELCGNPLAQAALHRFCRSGALDRLLRRLHAEYRRRMQCLLRAARIHLPAAGVRTTHPQGGFVFWFELDLPSEREVELLDAFAAAGVWLTPGTPSRVGHSAQQRCAFRLSIARCDEVAIATGLQRIGAVLRARL